MEAAKLFSGASLVLGLHGAGLSNAIFCRDGTPLVELALPEPTMRFFAHAAMALSLPYWPIFLDSDSFHKDVTVDTMNIVKVVRSAWESRNSA